MRRIVTAREQYEMLAPWRTAADDFDYQNYGSFGGGTDPNTNMGKQVSRANARVEEARGRGEHDLADYLENLRDTMTGEAERGYPRPWSTYEPMAHEEFDIHTGAAPPDWERKLIRKNEATDINGQAHSLDWGASKGYAPGERSSGLAPKCSCGWTSDSGSEAGGRRDFTQHIRSIKRTAAAHPDSHPDLHESFARHGCVHTSNGRRLGGWRTAAADFTGPQDITFKGFNDPAAWTYHKSFQPSSLAQQGARAYSSLRGLSDPHDGSINYEQIRTTPDMVRSTARHYDSLPTHDPGAIPHFDAMMQGINDQHDFMTNRLGIRTEVTDHDPYSDVHEMLHDVNTNKRLQVLGTHVTGGHPYIDNATNDKFRAVHDFFGHAATGRSFDRHGERAAYLAHAKMFHPQALPALASDLKGQNNSLIMSGQFAPQKLAVMGSQFLSAIGPAYSAGIVASVGEEAIEYLKDHPGGITFKHRPGEDAPKGGYMVALPHAEKPIPFEDLSPEEIDSYYDAHPSIADPDTPDFYGGWHEPPHWYHDTSQRIEDSYDAARAAVDGKQQAIFDNDKIKPWNREVLPSAYVPTSDQVNSGVASATGFTMARRRRR